MNLPYINQITQQELCDHIEEDDFLLCYGNPVAIRTDAGNIVLLMAIEYYERMSGQKIEIKTEESRYCKRDYSYCHKV